MSTSTRPNANSNPTFSFGAPNAQADQWGQAYLYLIKNHPDPDEISDLRFWLDPLKWAGKETAQTGETTVFLQAKTAYERNFVQDKFAAFIEAAFYATTGSAVRIVIVSNEANDTFSTPVHGHTNGKAPHSSDNSSFLEGLLQAKRLQPEDSSFHSDSSSKALPRMEANDTSTRFIDPLAPPTTSEGYGNPNPYQQAGFRPTFSNGSLYSQTTTAQTISRIDDHLDSTLTFENYIVGPSNQFAFASASAIAEKSTVPFGSLLIYGPPAVGKTHLLHAIGNQIKKRNPNIRPYFVSAETFVNEFVESLQHKSAGDFRSKYRENIDILLIDDIQFVVGKQRSEEEFIHTFNTLRSLKKMIIMTSDKAPKDIDGLEERIRTRFEEGLVADIRPPEIETRIAILKAKAETDDVYLPDDVATFLGTYVKDTVRNLHGALVKLHQYASLTGSEINIDLAKQVLQNVIPEESQEYTVEMILNAVCKHFTLKLKDLKGVSRAKNFSEPRQISMYLIRKYANLNFREIGLIFGKDHSTAVHAYRKIESDIEHDTDLKRKVEAIREQL